MLGEAFRPSQQDSSNKHSNLEYPVVFFLVTGFVLLPGEGKAVGNEHIFPRTREQAVETQVGTGGLPGVSCWLTLGRPFLPGRSITIEHKDKTCHLCPWLHVDKLLSGIISSYRKAGRTGYGQQGSNSVVLFSGCAS